MKIVWNRSDGCLVHLENLKLKKVNIETGGMGFVPQFLWVIVDKPLQAVLELLLLFTHNWLLIFI